MFEPSRLTRRDALNGLTFVAVGALGLPGALAAHPLPGAVITLAIDGTRLSLTVSVPFTDLALAMGTQRPKAPDAGPLPPELESALTNYFADHMSVAVEGQPDLDLQPTRTRLERATHEHLGAYTLLVMDFSAPLETGVPSVPLILTYDAVMHEVRNQRAEVYVKSTAGKSVPIGVIKRDPNTGTTAPLVIQAIP